MDFADTDYLLKKLIRIENGIKYIAYKADKDELDKCVNGFIKIVNECKIKIDPTRKILDALILEQVQENNN